MGPCPRVAATSRLQYTEALSCRQHCWARTAYHTPTNAVDDHPEELVP